MSVTKYALCYCTDAQHAEPDRESWRTDRAAVEEGLALLSGTDWLVVHEVSHVETVTEVEFVNTEAADHREAMLHTAQAEADARAHAALINRWAATTNQLPDDVKDVA